MNQNHTAEKISPPPSMSGKHKLKRLLTLAVFFGAIPALMVLGVWLLKDRSYIYVSMAIAVLACVPFFISFERGKKPARDLIVIAVMTAISVAGRFIFAPVPGFKPVTAIVIIAAASLGGEAGFIIGSLSAIVSNMYFGQGPWAPFQMFAWGSLGFLSGVLGRAGHMKKTWVMLLVGVLGGALYSVMMDVWTVLAYDGTFNLSLYTGALVLALPWMAAYAASNVVFLLALSKPIGRKLDRLKTKYGLFSD